jgi:hypothetical protein
MRVSLMLCARACLPVSATLAVAFVQADQRAAR